MEEKKFIWGSPWGYRASMFTVAAMVFGGFLLQLLYGPFNFYFLHRPVNYIVGALMLILSVLSLSAKNNELAKRLSGIHLAASLMVFLLIFSLIMGLTPQMTSLPQNADLWARLGFAQVTSSWPFIIIYLATLMSLAMTVARRVKERRKGDLVFLLNHVGLWLVLAAAGLGAADMRRHVMYVQEGQMEWRVHSDDRQVMELPLAIRLDDFIMEEYPARLAIIDRKTGAAQPPGRPELYQFDPEKSKTSLLDWDIQILDYHYQAVPAGAGAYQYSNMPASTQAVQVIAQNHHSKIIRLGWLSPGNSLLPPSTLFLDDKFALVMAQAEAKRFVSKIKVFAQSGQETEAEVEVNSPLRVGDWLIYQYGYDNRAGRMSTYSSFELIYDPWLYPVYAGLILWALGALGLIVQGKPGRGKIE
ncbi:MAG: cytochrome c biogenesis protein ResB [Candidatus Adiutrix sp.]|nr:cytochrome c biogenesis protein ResB [Candidatus Adiutrix sp.]